jgi:hypothetical protein
MDVKMFSADESVWLLRRVLTGEATIDDVEAAGAGILVLRSGNFGVRFTVDGRRLTGVENAWWTSHRDFEGFWHPEEPFAGGLAVLDFLTPQERERLAVVVIQFTTQ